MILNENKQNFSYHIGRKCSVSSTLLMADFGILAPALFALWSRLVLKGAFTLANFACNFALSLHVLLNKNYLFSLINMQASAKSRAKSCQCKRTFNENEYLNKNEKKKISYRRYSQNTNNWGPHFSISKINIIYYKNYKKTK